MITKSSPTSCLIHAVHVSVDVAGPVKLQLSTVNPVAVAAVKIPSTGAFVPFEIIKSQVSNFTFTAVTLNAATTAETPVKSNRTFLIVVFAAEITI